MTCFMGNLRDRGSRRCSALAAHVRAERRYADYSRRGALLAAAVWLFGQMPPRTDAMAVVTTTPALMLLWGALCVGGSALACTLGLVGVWRRGRRDVAFSALAVVLCCLPGL